jgi:hypothetical protein
MQGAATHARPRRTAVHGILRGAATNPMGQVTRLTVMTLTAVCASEDQPMELWQGEHCVYTCMVDINVWKGKHPIIHEWSVVDRSVLQLLHARFARQLHGMVSIKFSCSRQLRSIAFPFLSFPDHLPIPRSGTAAGPAAVGYISAGGPEVASVDAGRARRAAAVTREVERSEKSWSTCRGRLAPSKESTCDEGFESTYAASPSFCLPALLTPPPSGSDSKLEHSSAGLRRSNSAGQRQRTDRHNKFKSLSDAGPSRPREWHFGLCIRCERVGVRGARGAASGHASMNWFQYANKQYKQ